MAATMTDREQPSQEEMMRQLIAYAMEDMRNRGLEEAARLCERADPHGGAASRYWDRELASSIRRLKRDPGEKLGDWWGHLTVGEQEPSR